MNRNRLKGLFLILGLVYGQSTLADVFYLKAGGLDPTSLSNWQNAAGKNPTIFLGGNEFVIPLGISTQLNSSWGTSTLTVIGKLEMTSLAYYVGFDTVRVLSGGELINRGKMMFGGGTSFRLYDKAIYRHATKEQPSTTIFRGLEYFHPQSIFILEDWSDRSDELQTNLKNEISSEYTFGTLVFDLPSTNDLYIGDNDMTILQMEVISGVMVNCKYGGIIEFGKTLSVTKSFYMKGGHLNGSILRVGYKFSGLVTRVPHINANFSTITANVHFDYARIDMKGACIKGNQITFTGENILLNDLETIYSVGYVLMDGLLSCGKYNFVGSTRMLAFTDRGYLTLGAPICKIPGSTISHSGGYFNVSGTIVFNGVGKQDAGNVLKGDVYTAIRVESPEVFLSNNVRLLGDLTVDPFSSIRLGDFNFKFDHHKRLYDAKDYFYHDTLSSKPAIITDGIGSFTQYVKDGSWRRFPVGANDTERSGVKIGISPVYPTGAYFSVRVQNKITQPVKDTAYMIKKEWYISSDKTDPCPVIFDYLKSAKGSKYQSWAWSPIQVGSFNGATWDLKTGSLISSGVPSSENVLTVWDKEFKYPFVIGNPSGVKGILPVRFVEGGSIYPNPAHESTTVSCNLSEIGSVLIELFDKTGQKIKTLVNEKQIMPGIYEKQVDLTGIAVGHYVCKVYIQEGKNSRNYTQYLIVN